MTLGAYLQLHGYSAGFRDHYVAPMCAAVWSVPNAQVRRGGGACGGGQAGTAGCLARPGRCHPMLAALQPYQCSPMHPHYCALRSSTSPSAR